MVLWHSWVELDRKAFVHNTRALIRIARPARLLAVVKGNAYGHGMEESAKVLAREPIWGFGVAGVSEALALRRSGVRKPIVVLSYLEPHAALTKAIRKDIALVVHDSTSLNLLQKLSKRFRKRIRVHVKIDTGTTRIGFLPDEAPHIVHRIAQDPHFILEGVFSHFSSSEDAKKTVTIQQLERFLKVIDTAKLPGKPLVHIACSAALLRFSQSRLSLARAGIALYGIWPSDATKKEMGAKISLRPVLQWKAKVVQVKRVPKNTFIGYDQTYRTTKATTIATLSVGYADGYSRSLSNRGMVLLHGKRAPIRGIVSMNLLMVDVSHISGVHSGDTATLLGKEGSEEISSEEMARLSKTIPYEVVTRISPSLPRVFT